MLSPCRPLHCLVWVCVVRRLHDAGWGVRPEELRKPRKNLGCTALDSERQGGYSIYSMRLEPRNQCAPKRALAVEQLSTSLPFRDHQNWPWRPRPPNLGEHCQN